MPPIRLRVVLAPVQAPHASRTLVRRDLCAFLLHLAARAAQRVGELYAADFDGVVEDVG